MTGQTLAHYQVLKKLGAGGRGEVYRARDTRLGRDVAIKVLSPAFAQDNEGCPGAEKAYLEIRFAVISKPLPSRSTENRI